MLWPLQQAVHAALTGDATLMGRIAGVYDQVPQGTVSAAYVVIGDGEAREWDTDLETGLDADVMIHGWDSTHRGRRTVKQVQGDIRRILHRQDLAIDSPMPCSASANFPTASWTPTA
jgi:hypothetical protein